MACLPALPEPPVNTMRFPEDIVVVIDENGRGEEREEKERLEMS